VVIDMVKYGYSSGTNERTYHEYICDHCGKHLGGIEIVYGTSYTKEFDSIVGWNFCPYCGKPLWDEKPWLE
jgi:hypothetical protein